MIPLFIKRIMLAGIDSTNQDNGNPIRIINTISIMIFSMLVVQFPVIIHFWHWSGPILLASLVLHSLLFLGIPYLNAKNHFLSARATLMFGYISYISISSLIWQVPTNFHYFLIVGLFVSPFVYYHWESHLIAINCIVYFLCFVGLDFFATPRGSASWMSQSVLVSLNGVFLFTAALLSSLLVRNNSIFSQTKSNLGLLNANYLLAKVLPKNFIKQLSENNQPNSLPVSRHVSTVIFADIQGYTQLCRSVSDEDLVTMLDALYCELDKVTQQYQLEKIKTNGDQYIAVSREFDSDRAHATAGCLCAFAMHRVFQQFCQRFKLKVGLRIGLATGQVSSGVMGIDKLSYDVWGSTVNLAARLESSGEAGLVQVCPKTFELVNDKFIFRKRNENQLKGIGTLTTFWCLSEINVPSQSG